MYEYGAPAEWANDQKWVRRKKAVREAALGIAAALLALTAIYLLLTYGTLPGAEAAFWAAAIAVPAGIFGTLKYLEAKKAWKRSGQAKVGVTSEKQTRAALRKEGPLIAAYGLQLAKWGGDLDLILVTHGLRVAAVEIKTGFGDVTMYGNQIRAGRNLIKGDPLGQIEREATKLERALNTTGVLRVVCIPGMKNRPFMENGTLITGPRGIVKAINKCAPAVFDDDRDAVSAIDGIARECGAKRRRR